MREIRGSDAPTLLSRACGIRESLTNCLSKRLSHYGKTSTMVAFALNVIGSKY
jgi:hypothetical protein